MSTITVRQEHSLSLDEARERINAFEENLNRFGASLEWEDNRGEVKGFGVSGNIVIEDTFVELELKLGMMARAAGVDPVRLEASISKRLAAVFSDEGEAEEASEPS